MVAPVTDLISFLIIIGHPWHLETWSTWFPSSSQTNISSISDYPWHLERGNEASISAEVKAVKPEKPVGWWDHPSHKGEPKKFTFNRRQKNTWLMKWSKWQGTSLTSVGWTWSDCRQQRRRWMLIQHLTALKAPGTHQTAVPQQVTWICTVLSHFLKTSNTPKFIHEIYS